MNESPSERPIRTVPPAIAAFTPPTRIMVLVAWHELGDDGQPESFFEYADVVGMSVVSTEKGIVPDPIVVFGGVATTLKIMRQAAPASMVFRVVSTPWPRELDEPQLEDAQEELEEASLDLWNREHASENN